MMRLRRASAIVILSLLISAATAHAECAWVLWKQGPGVGEIIVTAVGAWPEREGCEAERQVRQARYIGREIPAFYVCLPDTVNPRGAKGK
jgi:hypothetical protein